MDSWKRFDETLLPNKETFYTNLNMEDITDVDYKHANNVFKKFKLKNLGEYHNLMFKVMHYRLQTYLKILETCIEVHKPDTDHVLSAPGLENYTKQRKN